MRLIGIVPPDGTVASHSSPPRRTEKRVIELLPALTAYRSSPSSTIAPCEPRPPPVPVPPVG